MSKIDWNLLRNGARRANDPQYQDVFDKQFELYEEIKQLRENIKAANEITEEHYEEIVRLQQDVKYYRELLRAAKVPEWVTIYRKTIV